ncbi:hypothetical protein F4780DRAFT_267408 [Xylariomycetidae sp. FL0641]|nr:hypothetical protein F4780DRAFT_267408 [Xylariomycetidae sp. FL0641]
MPPRKGAEPEPQPQWPPRSPHDVLMSTPRGRERLRRLAERASPSPSPTSRRYTPGLGARSTSHRVDDVEDDGIDSSDDDEDDDESTEVLQLKLAAIQAKLKLKKLQGAKGKKSTETKSTETRVAAPSRTQSRSDHFQPSQSRRPQPQATVEVPASPVRKVQPPQDTTSPSRVRLGIDKGLRAKDVSLKRAPTQKKPQESQYGDQGANLRRAHTPGLSSGQDRPKSFSERLAAARTEEADRVERRERVRQSRSKAFTLDQQELEQFKSKATEIPDVPQQAEQYSREEVVAGAGLQRSSTMPTLRRPTLDECRSAGGSFGSQSQTSTTSRRTRVAPSEVPEEDASGIEPYSCLHLSKRIIPHSVLTRNLSGKKTYVIKDLLKHVKAPDFQLPEVEQDIVVFGILASKSDPRAHKTPSNLKEKREEDPARGKYMILRLVDLQWELELFLFNSGFDRFWKLTPGTLLAILNPTVMPPPPGRTDTGRFSLVINSAHDTIIEIGTARDLGFCKSVKKDGAFCNAWVNRKRTEFCEFHMNLAHGKHRAARQDVNAFNTGLGPGTRNGTGDKRYKNSYRLPRHEEYANDPNKHKRGNYDRDTQSALFVHRPSAASLIDQELLGQSHSDRVGKADALRRRLVAQEKERELMKQLGNAGSGAGKEYMAQGGGDRRSQPRKPGEQGSKDSLEEEQPRDARSLGLVGQTRREIRLSPIKRKRENSVVSSFSSLASTSGEHHHHNDRAERHGTGTGTGTGGGGLGWGGNLRDKLARLKQGETLQQHQQQHHHHHPKTKHPLITPEASSFEGGAGPPSSSHSNTAPGFGGLRRRPRVGSESDASGGGGGGGGGVGGRPARKKTRFVTDKGIREAGRDSLAGDSLAAVRAGGDGGGGRGERMVVLDDDDDEEDEDLLLLDA